jgi:lipopolysaccharide/colanic/teichoic acid biosynthesis glycosyltransferase
VRLSTIATGPAAAAGPALPAVPRFGGRRPQTIGVRWQDRYAMLVQGAELTALIACVTIGVLLAPQPVETALAAGGITLLVVASALRAGRAWEAVILGSGPTEYRRVGRAVLTSAVVLALAGLALQLDDLVRPWVFDVLPAFAAVAVLLRHGLRSWLHRQRRSQRFQLPVLAVGSHEAVAELIARTRRDQQFGWTVTGACTSTGTGPGGAVEIDGVPVVGDLEAIPAAVREADYRVVAVAPGPGWGPRRLHELAWQLEGTRTELAVDPGLMEIGGPRLQLTPVDSMPLVTLGKPRLVGGRRVLKNVFDKVGAGVVLVVAAPAMVLIAAVLKLGGGPVLCREMRIGEGGRPYSMGRFRITRTSDGALSRVGRVLQRYSIDELPQVFDVLAGRMSLVGPRPPRPEELVGADVVTMRRLLVRPGMTGLWQVLRHRERTNLDESVRLDLRYVENWSLTLDIVILVRTARSLLRRGRLSAPAPAAER